MRDQAQKIITRLKFRITNMKNPKLVVITGILVSIAVIFLPSGSKAQELRLDHVIQLCPDLPDCIDEYTDLNFHIKEGTLHENGLRNAHIKFPNSSSMEFITLEGPPSDLISKRYDQLLRNQTIGAYLALTGLQIPKIQSELNKLNIEFETSSGKLWSYILFDETSELAHIFFIVYHLDVPSAAEVSKHRNRFDHIESVTMESTPVVIKLLTGLGLKAERIAPNKYSLATHTGSIILNELRSLQERPKIQEVVLAKSNSKDNMHIKLD
jgi:hypothetical protein